MKRLAIAVLAVVGLLASCGGDSAGTDPGVADVPVIDPGTSDPGTTDPGATDPGVTDPGTTDVPFFPKPKVAVNEVVHKTIGTAPDWIELYNPGDAEVDLSGFFFKDNADDHVFKFPAGTKLAAGAFLLVYCKGGTAPLTATFSLGDEDMARIFDATGTLVDIASWTKTDGPEGKSWGRYPDGTGAFMTLSKPTPGAANAAP